MVKGWRTFSDHFAGYEAHFVVIGGTATELAMTDAAIPFRGTKDLDIVLVVEALTAEFATHFWAFIRAGGYTIQASKDGRQPKRYRFVNARPPGTAQRGCYRFTNTELALCFSLSSCRVGPDWQQTPPGWPPALGIRIMLSRIH